MKSALIVFVMVFMSSCCHGLCAEVSENAPMSKRVVRLPPEAFTNPKEHIVIVNHNGALDSQWLKSECDYMKGQLFVNVKSMNYDGDLGTDYRAAARMLQTKAGPDAKILILVTDNKDAPAIMTAPYENWAVVNSGWIKASGGGSDIVNLRMGKRMFQALGHCIGAGYRMERESNLRYSPTPESMDDCLSHGFHPLNLNIFSVVSKAIGLENIRLRPRSELIRDGIFPAPASTNEPSARKADK